VLTLYACTCALGEKHVLALGVKCNDDSDSECKWEGTVYELEEHVAACQFALVACPKQCKGAQGQINHYTKNSLGEHLEKYCPNRQAECENCGEKGTYASIKVHDKVCKKKMVSCPNDDCIDAVQRQSIEMHLGVCSHTQVACKYCMLGCDVWMKRHAIAEHEDDDKLHLRTALNAAVRTAEEVALIQERIEVIGAFINTH
jgi:hypothetical protein